MKLHLLLNQTLQYNLRSRERTNNTGNGSQWQLWIILEPGIVIFDINTQICQKWLDIEKLPGGP